LRAELHTVVDLQTNSVTSNTLIAAVHRLMVLRTDQISAHPPQYWENDITAVD
jgi:hypothetical protein